MVVSNLFMNECSLKILFKLLDTQAISCSRCTLFSFFSFLFFCLLYHMKFINIACISFVMLELFQND